MWQIKNISDKIKLPYILEERGGNIMKKIFKLSMMSLVALFALFVLVGCAGISDDFADEIEDKAEAGEHYTYEELVDKLGEPTVKAAAGLGDVLGVSGVVQWSKGCENADEVKEKLDAGKVVKTLYVTFLNGKAMSAEYEELGDE